VAYFTYTAFVAKLPILTGENNPILRKKTTRVPQVTKEVRKLLKDMRDTTKAADGAGLAAPQVGSSLRVCVTVIGGKLTALINPELAFKSEKKVIDEEGCLSLPGLTVQVPRHAEVVVTFLDEKGRTGELRLMDFDARVVQHEVDHLDGILLVDYLPPTTAPVKPRASQATP
jgi:peptide deformylase